MQPPTTITTTPKTALTVVDTNTTPNQWYNITMPASVAALSKVAQKPDGFKGLSSKEALLATVAHTVNVDALNGLAGETARNIMQQLALRTLQTDFQRLESSAPTRANVVATVLNTVLKTKLKHFALMYIRADTKAYSEAERDELLDICEKTIREDFGMLSIAEIERAFAEAAQTPEFSAYGALNVKVVFDVLKPYLKRRNLALSTILDEQKKIEDDIAALQNIAGKNDKAYEEAKAQLLALQKVNKTHKTFHTCPAHYVRRFMSEGLMHCEDKKAVYAEACAQLAYDLLIVAPTVNARKSLAAFLTQKGITPAHSTQVIDSDVIKQHTKATLDYFKPEAEFKTLSELYYAKKLYLCNIQIFEQ